MHIHTYMHTYVLDVVTMRHVLAMMFQAIQKNSCAVIDALLEMLDSEWHVACLRSGVYVSTLLYCCFTAALLLLDSKWHVACLHSGVYVPMSIHVCVFTYVCTYALHSL